MEDQAHWRHFWITALASALAAALLLWLSVLLVDPFDAVFFSPAADRTPVATNQRFSFPALARDGRFDSAIFGTSATRLLRPERLDPALDSAFANLSMNSGMAWEQAQLFGLFARAHPRARYVVFGIDQVWCAEGSPGPRLTERPFPPWLYDEDPWNNLLPHFSAHAIETAGRQLAWLTGLAPLRYGRDGYTNFLPDSSEYDLARARRNIYGQSDPLPVAPVAPVAPADPAWRPAAGEREAWNWPDHGMFRDMLAALPAETRVVVLFVPYHYYIQPRAGSREAALLEGCKQSLAGLARARGNAVVMDFMIPSDITRTDGNYWDSQHYNVAVADRLADAIAGALNGGPADRAVWRDLTAGPAAAD